jgi:O-acetyl-ADP-ribose deacetylase (regulator of RNase III)
MKMVWHNRITIVAGDITRQHADAIVNAANPALLDGGGVDGAIHRAAGPGLLEECRSQGVCDRRCRDNRSVQSSGSLHNPYRRARMTGRAAWREDALLARCYGSSLRRARVFGFWSVAFPAISTGA